MQRYDTYKDSGVKWLGEIPSHWEVIPMKYCMQIKNGMDYKQVVADYGYPVIGSGGQFAYASDYMHDGEVVFFGRKGTIDKPLHFKGKFWAVDTMFYAIPKKIYGKFLYYVGLTIPYKYYSTATALPSMTQTDLGNNPICFPPLEEQTAIANYLDTATTKIDAAIAQQQKMIDLLNERKQIIINRAVTKGLNPNAKMKDSGVEWIGEVPEGWEVRKLKHIAKLQSGDTISSDSFTETGYPVFGGNGFRGYTNRYTNDGDYVLIGRQGALCGNVNYAHGQFFASEHAVVVYPHKHENIVWLGEVIRASNLNQYSQSAAQPGLAVSLIQNICYPYPPKEEREGIALYIAKNIKVIDEGIKNYQEQISLLQERKQIIINEVVTGKVRVV